MEKYDIYFMKLAIKESSYSLDSTNVGAVISDIDGTRILSIGYNHFLNGEYPTNRKGEWLDTKYPYIVHAEVDAIMNSNLSDIKNGTMYVTLFPCNECAKLLILAGIKRLVYLDDKYIDKDYSKAAIILLENNGVKIEKINMEDLEDGK